MSWKRVDRERWTCTGGRHAGSAAAPEPCLRNHAPSRWDCDQPVCSHRNAQVRPFSAPVPPLPPSPFQSAGCADTLGSLCRIPSPSCAHRQVWDVVVHLIHQRNGAPQNKGVARLPVVLDAAADLQRTQGRARWGGGGDSALQYPGIASHSPVLHTPPFTPGPRTRTPLLDCSRPDSVCRKTDLPDPGVGRSSRGREGGT